MKTIIRLSSTCLALSKVDFASTGLKLRALVWTLKAILPEGCRFIDHNFRPYFSYSTLDEYDRKFLQSALTLFETKSNRSMYLQILIQDIQMLLGHTDTKTEHLLKFFEQIYHLEPLSKPLKMIELAPKAKNLLNRNKKLAPRSAEFALRETYTILESLQLKPFLMSGTLLGLIRENRFLSHDIDIDIGILGMSSFDEVKAACETSGLFKSISSDQNYVLKLAHHTGIILDIFFHWNEDDQVLHGSTYLIWQNTSFDFSGRLFYDHKYRIPKNFDLYLEENYGDWKVPQQKFNILYDTPNVSINRNWDGLIYLCLNAALTYQAKEVDKLRSLSSLVDTSITKEP